MIALHAIGWLVGADAPTWLLGYAERVVGFFALSEADFAVPGIEVTPWKAITGMGGAIPLLAAVYKLFADGWVGSGFFSKILMLAFALISIITVLTIFSLLAYFRAY